MMATTFDKLNFKNQSEIVILNAPTSFEAEIATLPKMTVHRSLDTAQELQFALAFVSRRAEVDAIAGPLVELAKGDAILWFAYPKQSSKRLKCDFNRDTGWEKLITSGWETVRAVSIDEDWSALRFRRSEFVKSR